MRRLAQPPTNRRWQTASAKKIEPCPLQLFPSKSIESRPGRYARADAMEFRFAETVCRSALSLWRRSSRFGNWFPKRKRDFIVNFAHVPAPSAVAEAAVEFFQAPKSVAAHRQQRQPGRHRLRSRVVDRLFRLGLLIGRCAFDGGYHFDTFRNPATNSRRCMDSSRHSYVSDRRAKHDFHLLSRRIISHPPQHHPRRGNLDRRLIYAAQTLGARTWPIFREVVFPGALPSIVTGLTIGMGTCWFLVVTAEMISGQFGIGYFTWESYTCRSIRISSSACSLSACWAWSPAPLVRFLGERLMPWHRHATTRDVKVRRKN